MYMLMELTEEKKFEQHNNIPNYAFLLLSGQYNIAHVGWWISFAQTILSQKLNNYF